MSERRRHGDIGTFIVKVQQNVNNTWQGRITWVEEDKTLNFRSVWEMVKLMEDGLVAAGEIEEETPTWDEA